MSLKGIASNEHQLHLNHFYQNLWGPLNFKKFYDEKFYVAALVGNNLDYKGAKKAWVLRQ